MTYKWAHPSEWLEEKIAGCRDFAELDKIAMAMLHLLDGDQIQDTFQSRMDQDGYFESLEPTDQVVAIRGAKTLDELLAAINRDPNTWYDHNGDDYSDIPHWGPETAAVEELIEANGPHGDLVSWDTRSDDMTEHRYLRRTWYPALPARERQSFAIVNHEEGVEA